MTDQRTERVLRTYPSAIELLAADYPQWGISRVRDGAAHGDWQATRDGVVLAADSPAGLLVRLEAQELSRLQEAYKDRYWIRRTPSLWIATCRTDNGSEPTLMRDTSCDLEAAMQAPGTWGQVPPMRRTP
ncbi:hypothetical protein [Nocardiopsis tropica]|uniref:DUF3293 domain-containing protein n=1 Tax=Nocardiopsis tropica TaxID=109330 RepID=A0ABU7KQW1_9ACTN|nr:hypothetical protein [Nocardiopsis umidischolae]MEE2051673.1 hypothetical protein [Nocardiopsis umidischolae]